MKKRSTTKEELINACKGSNGPAQVLKKLGLSENGACRAYLKKISKLYDVEIPKYKVPRKYELIKKNVRYVKSYSKLLLEQKEKK